MKLFKLAIGLLGLSLAACSSEDPQVPQEPGDNGDGTSTMYLNINITDANSGRSRVAGFDEDGKDKADAEEGDYVFGTEHEVINAVFFFYDSEGNFVTRANVWQPSDQNDAPNIEYMGNNTLVLRNLTKNNLPQWVITVLNPTTAFINKVQNTPLTLAQTRSELMDIKNGENFIMSTTSFVPSDDTPDKSRYDIEHFGATKLFSTDYSTEPVTVMPSNAVKIYVERLAAKFSLTGTDLDGIFPVDVTIAGMDNNNNGNVELPSGSEKVYVKILGYGLTGQEKQSLLTKNITGFATTAPWTGWNNPVFYRSFWGMSPEYGKSSPNLKYSTFAAAKNSVENPIYGFETTSTKEAIGYTSDTDKNLIANNVTNVIFAARVYATEALAQAGGEDTGLDLVEFNGVYFTKDQYIKYALNNLYNGGGLRYYKNEKSTTETLPGGDEKTTYTYDPMAISDFTVEFNQPTDHETGEFVLKYTGTEQLYVKPATVDETGKFTPVEATALNTELAKFNDNTKAYAFTGGAMYYSVPIEHLNGKDKKPTYTVETLGEYGVVRNHWYQLKVGKVLRLGHGVFNPDPENGEEIKPGDKTETFALAAQINILSWKLVHQNVDL